jgi:hypothetical protein
VQHTWYIGWEQKIIIYYIYRENFIILESSRGNGIIKISVIVPETIENISDINTAFYNSDCVYVLIVSTIGTSSFESNVNYIKLPGL